MSSASVSLSTSETLISLVANIVHNIFINQFERGGNKNVHVKDNYKGTKFPNESNFVARSQILMFPF